MYEVVEAHVTGGVVRAEVVGRFETEEQAASYAQGRQQVERESEHLWFVKPAGERPTWVVDESGLKRRPTGEETETFFS